MASEAMQRAADAMIAATESFRMQLRARESLAAPPATYHASTRMEGGENPRLRRSAESTGGESEYGSSQTEQDIAVAAPMPPPHLTRSTRRPNVPPLALDPVPSWPLRESVTSVSPTGLSNGLPSPYPATNWVLSSPVDTTPVLSPVLVTDSRATSFGQTTIQSYWDGKAVQLSEVQPMFQQYQQGASEEMGQGAYPRTPTSRHPVAPQRPYGFSAGREILFVLVICLAQAIMLAGMAQALVPAAVIGESFPDTNPGTLAWYSASYGLTAGTFVLPSGRLGDLFGHKLVFTLGFLWLALWSLLAGFAPMIQDAGGHGTVFFCFSRAMQGIGPALLVPNGQAMLGRAYPPGKRKNMVMALFGAAAPAGFVMGAVMSSLFAVKTQWPWAFWTMAATCVALAALGILALPPADRKRSRDAGGSFWGRLGLPVMALGISGLVLVNFSINQAPIVSWSTPYTYFLLIIGIILFIVFVYVDRRARYPLIPMSAMQPTAYFVLGCTATGWGCFGVWVYYSLAFLQYRRGWSPLLASAALAPAPLTGLAASLLTGFLMGRGIRPHWIMLASMCSFFVGSLLFATAPIEQSYWLNSFFAILIMPFGMDMSNPAAIM